MDLDSVRKFFNLALAAVGIFVLIFIVWSIFVVSKIAQDKRKQEIKKGYAEEYVSPTPAPVKLP